MGKRRDDTPDFKDASLKSTGNKEVSDKMRDQINPTRARVDEFGEGDSPGVGPRGHINTRVGNALRTYSKRHRKPVEETRDERTIIGSPAKKGNEAALAMVLEHATSFAVRTFRMPQDAAEIIAQDAVTFIWEEVRCGRLIADDMQSFWALVSKRIYVERTNANRFQSKHMSLSAPLGTESDAGTRYDSGLFGITRATQIDDCFAHQVQRGIALLPLRLREVMERLAMGENAIDIAEALCCSVHVVFSRIKEARVILYGREFIALGNDKARTKP